MKFVHLARTPVAGQPLIIVDALNRYTPHEARLVTYDTAAYGPRRFPCDIDWQRDAEEGLAQIESADILHLHQDIDLADNDFGIDLRGYYDRGMPVIQQLHSAPAWLTDGDPALIRELLGTPIPQLTFAHHQERHYPNARAMPLMVPLADARLSPGRPPERWHEQPVLFSPTSHFSTLSSRWDTKGMPETLAMLQRCAELVPGMRIECATALPHAEMLEARRDSYLCLDDLVTGTYHTGSLESLAMGVPVLAHLDQRIMDNLRRLSGCESPLPWVNTQLRDAAGPLLALLRDRDLRDELGAYGRDWMLRNWHEADLVQHYVQAYTDLMDDPSRFPGQTQASRRLHDWFSRRAPDLAWESSNLIDRWRQLRAACSGRLVLCGDNPFGHWILEVLHRHGEPSPDQLASLDSPTQPTWSPLSKLTLGDADLLVLAADTSEHSQAMRRRISEGWPGYRTATLVTMLPAAESQVSTNKPTTTPVWLEQ